MIQAINNYLKNKNYTNLKKSELNNVLNDLINVFYDKTLESLNTIIFVMIDKFEYNLSEQDEEIKKIVEQRTKQAKFREEVILRDKECLITGDNFNLCEACHIIPYCESKSFDLENGLLFNKCFHSMFDSYNFSINSLDCIELSNKILADSTYTNYHNYNGKKIKLSHGSKLLLKIHYDIFIKLNKI